MQPKRNILAEEQAFYKAVQCGFTRYKEYYEATFYLRVACNRLSEYYKDKEGIDLICEGIHKDFGLNPEIDDYAHYLISQDNL